LIVAGDTEHGLGSRNRRDARARGGGVGRNLPIKSELAREQTECRGIAMR
jgi:hypothetical protein